VADTETAPKITDQERQQLQEQLEALGKAGAAISAAMAPFRKALAEIEGLSAALLERFGGELAATCEGCSKILFFGELGHRCGDGPTLCDACAPTVADCHRQAVEILEAMAEPPGDEDRKEQEERVAALASRVLAGEGEQKAVYAL